MESGFPDVPVGPRSTQVTGYLGCPSLSPGRILLRSIAAVDGHGGGVPGSTPVTREGVHAVLNAEDLVRHYALYHKGLLPWHADGRKVCI